MGLLTDLDMPLPSKDQLVTLTNFVDEKIHFLANPFGKKIKIAQNKRIDLLPGQLYIGYDKLDLSPVVIKDDQITTHYGFVGCTGSGKTCLAEDFIAKLYYQHNNIFTIIPDIKGERYEALMYKPGGKILSHLKDRLYKLSRYEAGMIRRLACEDTIIVIDFSSLNLVKDLISPVRDSRSPEPCADVCCCRATRLDQPAS